MAMHALTLETLTPRIQDDAPAITVCPDPSCLVFDRRTSALYVTDGGFGGSIVRVANGAQQRVATINSGGVVATNRIGGITLAPDGTLFISRIGHGQAGAIARIATDGRIQLLPGVPSRTWHGDLVHDDGQLFATRYMRSCSGPFDGSVVEVDPITGSCSMVIDGFLHPTGIAKLGQALVVADARQRAVFRISLAGGRGAFRLQLAGDIDRPDSVCACDDDSVLVTTYDDYTGYGAVRQIWLDGQARTVARGAWEPRGVATDGEHVFVATRRSGGVMAFYL